MSSAPTKPTTLALVREGRTDPRVWAAPRVQASTFNGIAVRAVIIAGARYYTLADAARVCGLADAATVRQLIGRNPNVFADNAPTLAGADAQSIAVLLAADARDSVSRASKTNQLRLLTDAGMVAVWSLTEAGQREIVDRFIGAAVDRVTQTARALVDSRYHPLDGGPPFGPAPWETPAYLVMEARQMAAWEEKNRIDALRVENKREELRERHERRIAKLRRSGWSG